LTERESEGGKARKRMIERDNEIQRKKECKRYEEMFMC